jgi:nucleoid-associated protein Lsr2
MAQRKEVRLIDDLDGGPAETTVSFAIDGVAYDIDLSAAHAEAFRRAIRPYIETARRARVSSGSSGRRRRASRQGSAAIRQWARSEGIAVSDRGRIPSDVASRYERSAERSAAGWDPGDRPSA